MEGTGTDSDGRSAADTPSWWYDASGSRWSATPPHARSGYFSGTPGFSPHAPPRRSRAWPTVLGVTALSVLLLVASVAPLALIMHAVPRDSPAAGVSPPAIAADQGPQPTGARPFHPSAAQRAYFLRIACARGPKGRVVRWGSGTVRVTISGPSQPQDRRVVNEILAEVDRTIGTQKFVYSPLDPQIVISMATPSAFRALPGYRARLAGWCEPSYTTRWRMDHANIVIKDDAEGRMYISNCLHHEFGHAIGLDDTRNPLYSSTVMYYQEHPGAPVQYTQLDLAAIRMLYDQQVKCGETRAELAHFWR